jgi:hypothetical protein
VNVWIALALAAVWVGTGPWRVPRSQGGDPEQLAAVSKRRSRLVGRTILMIAALWIVANIVIDISVALHG